MPFPTTSVTPTCSKKTWDGGRIELLALWLGYSTGMLAVTGSEHDNSYLQLVYRVGVVVVYRTGP